MYKQIGKVKIFYISPEVNVKTNEDRVYVCDGFYDIELSKAETRTLINTLNEVLLQ